MAGAFPKIGPKQAIQFLDPPDSSRMGVAEVTNDALPVVGLILMLPNIVQEQLLISIQTHAGKFRAGKKKAKRKKKHAQDLK
jgi:hypothetical protein